MKQHGIKIRLRIEITFSYCDSDWHRCSWTFGGAAVTEVDNILFVVGGAASLVGAIVPVIPAALLFLSAFGLTLPVVLK